MVGWCCAVRARVTRSEGMGLLAGAVGTSSPLALHKGGMETRVVLVTYLPPVY